MEKRLCSGRLGCFQARLAECTGRKCRFYTLRWCSLRPFALEGCLVGCICVDGVNCFDLVTLTRLQRLDWLLSSSFVNVDNHPLGHFYCRLVVQCCALHCLIAETCCVLASRVFSGSGSCLQKSRLLSWPAQSKLAGRVHCLLSLFDFQLSSLGKHLFTSCFPQAIDRASDAFWGWLCSSDS